jgi:hypothetical protein
MTTQSIVVNGQSKVVASGFNFESYNMLMSQANSGLRLFLAIQQLEEVEKVMRRFNSPYSQDIIALVDQAKKLRDDNKKYLASRQANQESLKKDNTTPANVDNPTGETLSTTDVQTELDRVKQAKDAGIIA